jgi:DNA-binding NarL/FixJ family response regulator
LRHVLAREFPSAEIYEAADAAQAMSEASAGPADLVLLDLELPDRSGLDLIYDLKKLNPNCAILVVSGEEEMEAGPRVLKAGANGFIHKTSPNAELLSAIHRILAGKKYVSPELAAALADSAFDDSASPHATLSDRELEVLKQFGRGLTTTQISENLGLSVKTVSTYRSRILEKIGLKTTGDLVRYAVKNGLA